MSFKPIPTLSGDNADFIANVTVSGSILGTGDGSRITNNGVPYLLSGDSPAENDTLQDVTTRGNTTSTSIISTGPYISGVSGLFSDNVGIGTTTPTFNLDIYEDSSETNPMIKLRQNGIGDASIGFNIVGSTQASIGLDNSDGDKLKISRSEALGSSTQLTIDSAGNVGIGTTSPISKLQVGDGSADDFVKVYYNDGTNLDIHGYGIEFNRTNSYLRPTTNGNKNLEIGANSRNWNRISMYSSDDFLFYNATAELVRITQDGNVGIGTASPNKKLEVNVGGTSSDGILVIGSLNPHIEAKDSTNSVRTAIASEDSLGKVGTISSTDLKIVTSNSERIRVDTSGNVGIGTTSPDAKLHVHNTSTTSDGDGSATETLSGQDSILLYGHGGTNGQTYGGITWLGGNRRRAMITAVAENTDQDHIGLAFYTQGTDGAGDFFESMRIAKNGNVGIGITDPDEKLEVDGNIKFTDYNDDLQFGNTANTLSYNKWLASASGGMGIYNSATSSTGHIYFQTSAGEKVRILRDGNVGIGTTSPAARLHLKDSTDAPEIRLENSSGGNQTAKIVYDQAGQNSLVLSTQYQSPSDGNLIQFAPAGNIAMTIRGGTSSNNGNVGIGTASPDQKLHIVDTDGANIILNSSTGAENNGIFMTEGAAASPYTNGAYVHYDSANNAFKINTGTSTLSTKFTILRDNGNVGIGTSPSVKLDVLGAGKFTGQVTIPLTPVATTDAASKGYVDGQVGASDTLQEVTDNGNATTNNLRFTNAAQKLYLDLSSGGTTRTAEIELYNGSDGSIQYKTHNSSTGGHHFYTQGSEKIRISRDGNVGIGTTSPSEKLEVSGNIKLTGNLNVGGYIHPNDENGNLSIYGGNNTTNDAQILLHGNSDLWGSLEFNYGYDPTNSFLRISQGSNEHLRITNGGKVGIGIINPSTKLDVDGLISSYQIQSKEYTSLTGNTNDWFPIGTVSDEHTGPVHFSVATYAHSSMSFVVGDGYSGSGTGNITLLNSVNNANGGYANISAARVKDDGVVEIKLQWSSGSTVSVKITARSTTNPATLPSSLATATSTSTVRDTVTNETGKLRSKNLITTDSNVVLNNSGISYLNGGNVGIGTTSPATKLHVVGRARFDDTQINAKGVFADYFSSGQSLTLNSGASANILFKIGNTTALTLDSSQNATFAENVYVGSATTNGGVINLIQAPTNPEIRIQSGESGTTAFSIYNTATNPDEEQFFINNTLGTSHLGNKRGALKLETSSGVALTLSGLNTTFAGDVTVSGGGITLGGTGRIQGVDTVSVATDAANKAYVDAQVGSADTLQEVTDNGNTTTNNISIGTTSTFTAGGTAKLSVNGMISWGVSSSDLSYFRRLSAGNFQWQTYNGGNSGNIHLQPYGGNVGIGTTSPSEPLEVVGTVRMDNGITEGTHYVGTALAHWGDGGTELGFGTDTITLKTASNAALTIDSSQNVGIGTTSPSYKLEVNGAAKISSALHINNTNGTAIVNAYSGGQIGTYLAKAYSASANFTTTGVSYPRGLGFGAIVGSGNTTDIPVNNSSWSSGFGGNIGFWSDVDYGAEGGTNSIGYHTVIKGTGSSSSYGFFGDLSGVTAGTRYGIYTKGEQKNYFSGNVGIGVTNPAEKLHVGGDIRVGNGGAGDYNRVEFTRYGGALVGGIGWHTDAKFYIGGHPSLGSGAGNDVRVYGFSSDLHLGDNTNGDVITIQHSSGNVGIGATAPQAKLQVSGGIQMADDTDTAAAAKVGTMRYRTGTEYVDVDGVELVTNGNFDSATEWNLNSNWAISSGTCNADGTSGGDINQAQVVGVVGQSYRITYVISAYTQGSISARIGSGVTTYNTGVGKFTQVVTATTTDRIRMNIASSFIGSVDSLSIVKVTAEDASYADMCMQTAASTYEWVNIVRNTY